MTTGEQGVLPQEPVATIFVPEGDVLTSPITRLGSFAVDAQDGPLDGPDVQWQVDNVSIGQGIVLENVQIAPGTHVLKLTATDSDANSIVVTRTIEVQ